LAELGAERLQPLSSVSGGKCKNTCSRKKGGNSVLKTVLVPKE